MSLLHLPHTPNCLVCGPSNRFGLHLQLDVAPATGEIVAVFTPTVEHTGFEGILHGGVLATVLDEAMVWAAIWSSRRACVAGEMNVRFRRPGLVGVAIRCVARVTTSRSRLIETTGELLDPDGHTIAEGTAKYIPLDHVKTQTFFDTIIADPTTAEARRLLTS